MLEGCLSLSDVWNIPLSVISGRRHQTCRCCSSCAALLLQHTEDNSLKSCTAIESELASRQPQLLLLQSKVGDTEGVRGVCVHTYRHTYPQDNKQLKWSSKCRDRSSAHTQRANQNGAKMRLKQTEIGVTQATMKQWKEEGHTHTHTPRSQNEPAVGKKKPSVPAFPLRLRLG